MTNLVYKYTGKPSKTQTIGTGYTKVTDCRWAPPGDGWLFSMLYANLKHTRGKTGGIRNQLVRENPIDETCYQDHAVTKDLVAPGVFLLQPIWFGAADKGRAMHWKLRRSSSLGPTTASTRYSKWLWFSKSFASALLTPQKMSAFADTGDLRDVLGPDLAEEIFNTAEGEDPVEIVV